MLSADKTPGDYNPDTRPIVELLKGLAARPPQRHVVVEKPGFRLELRGRG